jgi:S1-C subfamily serine protease
MVADSLRQYGRIRRGFLGIRSQAVELPSGASNGLGREQKFGLLVVGVERGGPADRAGMMVGDILVGLDGRPVEDHDTLLQQLAGNVAGQTSQIEISRGGRVMPLSVQVGERQ